jgi:hypothetical protein
MNKEILVIMIVLQWLPTVSIISWYHYIHSCQCTCVLGYPLMYEISSSTCAFQI